MGSRIMHPCRHLIAGLCIGVFTSAPAAEPEPLRLAPDQMRALAATALESGQAAQAAGLAEALVARDRSDFTAHLIQARALRDLGEIDPATLAARRAWSLAQDPDERYAAALIMAQVLSSADRRTRAQLWLRRAVQAAPNDQLAQKAIRDFRYVRATNPWSTRLSFAVSPESNINNGSSERSFFLSDAFYQILFGGPLEVPLDGSAQALSGIEYSFGFDTRYRFSQTATRAHDLTAALDVRVYTLSSEAKSNAPDAKGSDFSFVTYRFGYGHRGINFDRKGEYRLSADVGQSWYGGDEYTRFLRLSAGQSYKALPTVQLGTRLAVERQFGVTTADIDTLRSDLSLPRKLDSGTHLSFVLTGAVAQSPVASQEFDEVGLRAQVSLAQPVFGAEVVFGMGVRMRDYDVSRYTREGRQDPRTSADVTFIFKAIDYSGFNPTMTVSASHNDSNIGLYKSERFGVNFGIQSAF